MPCIGHVQCLVKAVPRDEECRRAIEALGLRPECQRFAIVEAREAHHVQKGCKGVDLSMNWAKATAKSLKESGALDKEEDFLTLLEIVNEDAMVLAVKKDVTYDKGAMKGKLKRTEKIIPQSLAPLTGDLPVLAIPLSSSFADWYHKEDAGQGNWAVEPMVQIDKTKAPVVLDDPPGDMQRPINAAKAIEYYFVRNFSQSNAKTAWRHV